nr:PREDICTED: receptor-like protein 12 [Daucus carota subsp. sativus]
MASVNIPRILPHVLVSLVIFILCMEMISSSGLGSVFENSSEIVKTRCIEKEKKALVEIRRGLADTFGTLSSWGSSVDCCQWRRVVCDNNTGHVTQLHLSAIDFPPPEKFRDNSFSWIRSSRISNISSSLLDLKTLNYLDLHANDFGGLPIPKVIGSLTDLVYLDLSRANFGKTIPDELRNLSKLNHLDLTFNSFDTSTIPEFISSFTSLTYLGLAGNHFSGEIPRQFGNLSKLQQLNLGDTDVLGGGIFGWLFNLSSLVHLDLNGISIGTSNDWVRLFHSFPMMSVLLLDHCNLTSSGANRSSFPTNLSSNISTLSLHQNFIDLSIFGWLSNSSSSLVNLGLSYNRLKGKIPEFLSNFTSISSIDLSNNQLHGVVPYSFRNLSGLKFVDFSSNNLTGNLQDLLNVFAEDNLQTLFIHENQLTGSLPDITRFTSLRTLRVASNKLNGYLPKHFKQNSVLEFLGLSDNSLTGFLPEFTGFPSLLYLNLENNNFFGSIPDFTGCSSLQSLSLGGNQLTKWETQSTGQLTKLYRLDLSMNSISSTISERHLTNLSSLRVMDTSYNPLTFDLSSEWLPPFQLSELYLASCKLGPKFPSWIRNQKELYIIDFSNSQISDTIPMWFWNVSSTVDILNISSNKIRGKFSSKHFNFLIIDLSSNYFEGAVPVFPARCLKINLSQNKFSGILFSRPVVEVMSLGFLDLSHNSLSDSLPNTWGYFKDLVFLNLGYNNFGGRIPTSMGDLVFLQTLIIRSNHLYGELPASLRNCTKLGFVDFGLNKISGKIPAWIGDGLPQLYALILRSNQFYGSMPYQLCRLSELHFLDLAMNRISGTVPRCFGNLTAMTKNEIEVTEHYYNISNGLAPTSSFVDTALAGWKGQEFEYGRNFAYLKMIDLSSNQLTGEIPIGITRLLDIKGLNLSRNRFYGKIPLDIGRLKMLESLDPSINKFSGNIPQSMSGLHFLGYLDLSSNNFSGKIPSGTQLQGFLSSTYAGNLGLCGSPLTKKCEDEPGDEVHPTSIETEIDDDEIEYRRWLYISAALGFSTTFWGICGSVLLNRRWRHAYFLFLNYLKDQLYLIIVLRIPRMRR